MNPQVSFTTEPELLIEEEETVSLLNFNLSEPPTETGTVVNINAPNLSEFNLTKTQVEGGEITLEPELQQQLQDALNGTRVEDVPGAAVAIVSPFGSWFGASGVASIENNTPLQPDDRFQIGSITKTFVATTVMQLVEEGKLNLDDTLTTWLPESITADIPSAEEITLEQLLQHTSGIADYVDVLFNQAATNPGVFLTDWQPEELVDLIDSEEPLFAPGESWQYSNTNFILAGLIVEAVTGNNIAAEIRTRILEPLNLENTFFAEEEEIPGGYVSGYWDFDQNGTLNNITSANLSWTWATGAMVSNTQDLDTFARSLFKGDLLEPETLKQMLDTTPAIDSNNYSSYGLGVGTIESPNRFWYIHRGQTLGYRSNMWYSPQDDLTYIELINGFSTDNLVRDLLPPFRQGIADDNFNFTITEQNAQISLPVLNDGEVEGEETATFTVEAGEGYEVNPDANSGTFTIVDTADENSGIEPIVSFSTEPELLIESQETASLLNFSLSEPPSSLGTTITVNTPNLSEFNLNSIQTQGGEINLNNDIQSQLETALAEKIIAQVPGATIAITSPLGNWSEAAGVANIENNTPLQPNNRFQIGSVTKTFTATTVLKLAEAGKLTLEDTLTDWLPQEVTANIPSADEITIRQLLNHTSGIAEYDSILLQQAVTNPTIFLNDWQPEQIVELIDGVEPFFEPGESWQYSNTNYTLAGMVIEAASDNNIAAEIRSQILQPLNLENTFFAGEEEIPGGYVSGYLDFDFDGILDDVSVANPSWTWTSGAIVSNTQDLSQFARDLYAGELLSQESLAQMFTLVDTGRGFSYGLGMMSFETPDLGTVVGHRGGTLGFNANMWYSSEDDFTYVDLANGRTNEELVVNTIPAFTEGVISTVGNTSTYSEFNFTITEQNAQISLPVLNDGEVEGEETATFTVEAGEGYEVDPDANSGIFTIVDSLLEPTSEPVFGSLEADIIEVSGSNKLIFGGDSDDLIDASISSKGGNRIYAGSGDDTVILGTADRIIGGAGDDKFFVMSGGDNIITGGEGADQFWIATAEIPDSANIITDFTISEDVLGIAGKGIGFEDLSITQQNDNTLIAVNGSDLAILQSITANSLSADNFAFA
ncbi:serine hydrolase [Plectonema radiosum]|uniref:serine hydrolase n=1 Tax=Plectonema radiosum TaxID=945768 RepID=UPI001D14D93A|nr:serine hydrolase [Plectonema radiosum]